MIPVQQRIVASGMAEGAVPGDCVKCCIASILDLPYEDVPHFVAGEVVNPNLCEDGTPHPDGPFKMDWYSGLRYWMKQRGYTVIPVHRSYFKDVDCQIAWRKEADATGRYKFGQTLWMYDARDQAPWHEGYWIASVISENFVGSTHAIVMQGSQVVFDPSTKPRRTPYQYVGEMTFVAPDPAVTRTPQNPAESAWLIENTIGSCAVWWRATPSCGRTFTTDANEAVRFPRKQDAEKVIRALAHSDPFMRGAKATDHMWCP